MITLIDYGVGNIFAFQNVYKRLNIPTKIAKRKEDLANAEKLILPGVGSFDYAMAQLNASGMREKLDELVLGKKVPVIGICVGMQMLGNISDESPEVEGLKFCDFNVFRMKEKKTLKLPHVGWNDVMFKKNYFHAALCVFYDVILNGLSLILMTPHGTLKGANIVSSRDGGQLEG